MDATVRFSKRAAALGIVSSILGALVIGISFCVLFFDGTPRAYFDLTVLEFNWFFLWVIVLGGAAFITQDGRSAFGLAGVIPAAGLGSALASVVSILLLVLSEVLGGRHDLTWSILAQMAVLTGWLSFAFILYLTRQAARVGLEGKWDARAEVARLVRQAELIELKLSRNPAEQRAGLLDAVRKLRNRLQYSVPRRGPWAGDEASIKVVGASADALGDLAAMVAGDAESIDAEQWTQRLGELTLRIEQATRIG